MRDKKFYKQENVLLYSDIYVITVNRSDFKS